MAHHLLKAHPEYFNAVKDGIKTFEIRKNDRNFNVNDTITLQYYDPETKEYGRESIDFTVPYMMLGGKFGLEEGYCILGMKNVYLLVDNSLLTCKRID